MDPREFQERLGLVLSIARTARGFSQEKLAERTKTAPDEKPIHKMTISAIERGVGGDTGILTLFRIIEALDTFSLADLFLNVESLKGAADLHKDLVQSAAASSLEAAHARTVSSPDAIALAELRSFIIRLSAALTKAAGLDAGDHGSDSGAGTA